MSPLPRLARSLLILHALLTIAQGLYCITNPQGWVGRAGPLFEGSGENGVRVVGLNALGLGWYQFIFSIQNNQALFAATVPLRLIHAAVMWKMGAAKKVVAWEVAVWGGANLAAWPGLVGGR